MGRMTQGATSLLNRLEMDLQVKHEIRESRTHAANSINCDPQAVFVTGGLAVENQNLLTIRGHLSVLNRPVSLPGGATASLRRDFGEQHLGLEPGTRLGT
jgi:hypothetical protein